MKAVASGYVAQEVEDKRMLSLPKWFVIMSSEMKDRVQRWHKNPYLIYGFIFLNVASFVVAFAELQLHSHKEWLISLFFWLDLVFVLAVFLENLLLLLSYGDRAVVWQFCNSALSRWNYFDWGVTCSS